MSGLVLLFILAAICALAVGGITAAIELRRVWRPVDRFLDDWGAGRPSAAEPLSRREEVLAGERWTRTPRWTEAQLFEPVSKWVEDAEQGIGPGACAECDAPARVRGLCVNHFNREQDRRVHVMRFGA